MKDSTKREFEDRFTVGSRLNDEVFGEGLLTWIDSHFIEREEAKQALITRIRESTPRKRGPEDIVQLMVYDQGTPAGKLHYEREYGKQEGFNEARELFIRILEEEEGR